MGLGEPSSVAPPSALEPPARGVPRPAYSYQRLQPDGPQAYYAAPMGACQPPPPAAPAPPLCRMPPPPPPLAAAGAVSLSPLPIVGLAIRGPRVCDVVELSL